MSNSVKRATIYLDADLHHALRLKAAMTHRTISDVVSDAVRAALGDDLEDLKAFQDRASESTITYQQLLDDLKAHGKL